MKLGSFGPAMNTSIQFKLKFLAVFKKTLAEMNVFSHTFLRSVLFDMKHGADTDISRLITLQAGLSH
jgi:hypothetical protein